MTLPKQKIVRFGPDYKLSIIQEPFHSKGKFEIAVLYKEQLVEMPGITDPDDTVARFKTPEDVQCIMKKLYSITGKIPENS